MSKSEFPQLDVTEFQAHTGLIFGQPALLQQALTHRSLVNEYPHLELEDNQRLEFLGDAVVDLLVAEWLYRRYPDAREGELTSLRADIVRTESLAGLAQDLGLGAYLKLGRGETTSGGALRPANLCDEFEALVGALYLDQGLDVARSWLMAILERHAPEIDQRRTNKDAKTQLQEYTQGQLHVTPAYRIAHEEGPNHARTFTAQVVVDQDVWGEGAGPSKQLAEQAAAEAALHTIRHKRAL